MMPFLICWKHRESKSMQKSGMHDIVERIKDDLKKNGIGCAAVLACLILFALIFHDVCPVQILYGLPCPGCGLTRAGVLLLTGHFAAAFQMHPFIYGWAALLLYVLLCRYVKGCKPKGASHCLHAPVLYLSYVTVFSGCGTDDPQGRTASTLESRQKLICREPGTYRFRPHRS